MSDASIPALVDIASCAVRTLALYSLAEFQLGHATTIWASAEGASFSVADDGRGHAIERTIGGSPYLTFVYTHLDYPAETAQGAPVQLHGLGMSLLNSLCSELSVTVRKREATLQLEFTNGKLSHQEVSEIASASTGNTISGTVNLHLQTEPTSIRLIEEWLLSLLNSNPSLKLHFNDRELHAHPRGAA